MNNTDHIDDFSKFELDFIDRFVTYISHCSNSSNLEYIFRDNRLQGQGDPTNKTDDVRFMRDKLFCTVRDVYCIYDNHYCFHSGSIEFQLTKSLLTTYKYYMLHEPQDYGSLYKAKYLSPHLFNLIKKSNFDREQFKANLEIEDFDDPRIKLVLSDEIEDIFQSKVVEEKYNPPITSLLINAIEKRKVNRIYGYTIAFLGGIDISEYVDKVVFSKDKAPDYLGPEIVLEFEKEKQQFIDMFAQKNIPTEKKSWNRP
jgi:hypothetical protein